MGYRHNIAHQNSATTSWTKSTLRILPETTHGEGTLWERSVSIRDGARPSISYAGVLASRLWLRLWAGVGRGWPSGGAAIDVKGGRDSRTAAGRRAGSGVEPTPAWWPWSCACGRRSWLTGAGTPPSPAGAWMPFAGNSSGAACGGCPAGGPSNGSSLGTAAPGGLPALREANAPAEYQGRGSVQVTPRCYGGPMQVKLLHDVMAATI